jgi:L-ascorbate metabolism protein UlaG (beta-lactamase superfamily)
MGKLTWLGHASVQIETKDGLTVYVDPWITTNPAHPTKALPEKADVILVTHDHFDHISDVVALAAKTGAKVVTQPETLQRLQGAELPEANGIGMNIGGTVAFGEFKAQMVQASHTSETGSPSGYIMTVDGKTIYHLGDTGIFGDLQLFGRLYEIDIALIPAGGHFTMDYKHAALAADMLKAKIAIPIHYRTFPLLLQDGSLFAEEVRRINPQIKVETPEVGEVLEF